MPVLGTQVIKSIQRGQTSLASTGTSTTVSINAVDLDKSFVSASCTNGMGGSRYDINSSSSWVSNGTTAGAHLSSTTQLSVTGGLGYGMNSTYRVSTNMTLRWEVIEYV